MNAIDFDKTNLHLVREKNKIESNNMSHNTVAQGAQKTNNGPMSKLLSIIQTVSVNETGSSRIQTLKAQIADKNYTVDFDNLSRQLLAEIDLV